MTPVTRRITITFTALALYAALVFSAGCGKSHVRWVYYDETRCDRWEHSNNNEKLKDNFVSYYDARGVKIYEVEIFSDRVAEMCADCSCKTGRRFKAKVKKNDVREVKRDGFYE